MEAQLTDKVGLVMKETKNCIVSIRTQIIHEPTQLVIVISKKYIDKRTGKTYTSRVHREFIQL